MPPHIQGMLDDFKDFRAYLSEGFVNRWRHSWGIRRVTPLLRPLARAVARVAGLSLFRRFEGISMVLARRHGSAFGGIGPTSSRRFSKPSGLLRPRASRRSALLASGIMAKLGNVGIMSGGRGRAGRLKLAVPIALTPDVVGEGSAAIGRSVNPVHRQVPRSRGR